MKRLFFALCTLGALLLTACGPNRSKELDNIRTLESTVREADMVASPETALQLTNSYLQFSQNFPDDSLTPIFLYNASDLSLNIGRYDTSLYCLRQIIDNYPDFSEASTCYFLIGNLFEVSEQYDSAVVAYNEFLEYYPDHPLAQSAAFAIKNIGLTPEQMLNNLLAETERQ